MSVTGAWLSEILNADVRHCRLEQIGVGVGLLGRIYRAHLEGPGVPESVVLKFPTLDERARTMVCEPLEFYLREVRFYSEIGLANPLPPARPYFAAFDELTHDFVLVLEDLGRLRVVDQTIGCTAEDATVVVDAIARHHAQWWDSERLTTLPWLSSYRTPPFPAVLAGNFEAAWPRFLDRLGADLSPEMRVFGERFPSLVPWYLNQIMRPPHTFLHGDLRLDQLFFAVEPDDPPVTALDWQVTSAGRGAYDVGYFLSQSLATDTRRACESALLDRYAQVLAEFGIDYPATELLHDYRLTTAWCFAYPVIGAGQADITNERQLALLRSMVVNSAAAIHDHDALALRPD
ncbi:ecdysteroid 22-kinase family protein [Mycolicibacterium sphagni]|nr:ecdysteroid 22-kinase family protein [Mycolicibacterium sphagni]